MTPTQSRFLRISAVLGALAVICGAFGAHGLEERISGEMLSIWHTAVQYHVYHALALLALSVAPAALWNSPWTARAGYAWLAGVAIFSGSLYVLALTELRWLGAITPIGGVAMIVGWALLIPAAKAR
jgi:uncharacterized membrane protein YgdD (TMEM256/DUF423 family)